MKIFFLLGCIATGLSVALGAFGAHGLENKVSAKMLEVWKTGVTYQMFHAGGLLIVALLMDKLQSSLVSATRLVYGSRNYYVFWKFVCIKYNWH